MQPKRRVRTALSVAVVAAVALSVGTAARAEPTDATSWAVDRAATAKVADLTGRGSVNDTGARYGVEGADLGHMFMVGPRMAMAFGDTFGAPAAATDFRTVPHADWRSNSIASIDPPASPEKGLAFVGMVSDRPGHAKELIASQKRKGVQESVIPTYGIATGAKNTTMNLQYMSVRSFDRPGHWQLTGSGMVSSVDGGTTWVDQPGARRPADSKFGQVAFVRPGGPDDPDAPVPAGVTRGAEVYVYGIPGGRYGDLSLARVAADRVADASAYTYWNGTDWAAGEASAVPVVRGPVGELSVRWNSFYRQWIMMYLVDDTGEIVLRTSPAPTGPWSPAQVVTTTKDFPQAYAPYLTPRWNDGPDLWFTMSQYTTYRVALMRTRLAATPAGVAPAAAEQPVSVPAREPSVTAPPVPLAAASRAAPTSTVPVPSGSFPTGAVPTTAGPSPAAAAVPTSAAEPAVPTSAVVPTTTAAPDPSAITTIDTKSPVPTTTAVPTTPSSSLPAPAP